MHSKDIIIRLIDEGKITGEEAYNLINDIIAAEILESVKTLNYPKDNTDLQKLIQQPGQPYITYQDANTAVASH